MEYLKHQKRPLLIVAVILLVITVLAVMIPPQRRDQVTEIVTESVRIDGTPMTAALSLPLETAEHLDLHPDAGIQKIAEFEVHDDAVSIYTVPSDEPQLLVCWNGTEGLFPMQFALPQGLAVFPYCSDVDGDGAAELVLIQQTGSGTGVSVQQLHIIEHNNGSLTDHMLSFEAIREQLLGLLETDKAGNTLSLNGAPVQVSENLVLKPSIGTQIRHEYENGLKAYYGIALERRDYPGHVEFPAVLCGDVNFAEGRYTLTNFRLIADGATGGDDGS